MYSLCFFCFVCVCVCFFYCFCVQMTLVQRLAGTFKHSAVSPNSNMGTADLNIIFFSLASRCLSVVGRYIRNQMIRHFNLHFIQIFQDITGWVAFTQDKVIKRFRSLSENRTNNHCIYSQSLCRCATTVSCA